MVQGKAVWQYSVSSLMPKIKKADQLISLLVSEIIPTRVAFTATLILSLIFKNSKSVSE